MEVRFNIGELGSDVRYLVPESKIFLMELSEKPIALHFWLNQASNYFIIVQKSRHTRS